MSFIVMNECALPKGYNHCPVATVMLHTYGLFSPQIVLITFVTEIVHFMNVQIDIGLAVVVVITTVGARNGGDSLPFINFGQKRLAGALMSTTQLY